MKVSIFIKNSLVLVITSLILRSSGMFFKIYISGKIGSEGMGLYQLIFSIYIFASTFASSGIVTAVTRLVSENQNLGKLAIKNIMKRAVLITLIVAFISTFIIFFGAEAIGKHLLKNIAAANTLKILSFSLPFMGISSCIRGYFIACRKTLEPSFSQIFEQMVRMGFVFALLSTINVKTIEQSAFILLFGDTVAEFFSCIVNWILYLKDLKRFKVGLPLKNTTKKMLKIAIPISSSSYLSTALHTAESLLIPSALAIFHGSRVRGLELFGAIRAMALPVLFFPASFLVSLSTMLIPEISSARANCNRLLVKNTVEKALSTTLLLSIFVSSLFFFNSYELGNLLYKNHDVGVIMKVLSPIIPFMYLESVCAGMLKGLDCQISMLKYNVLDSLLRITAIFILLPFFGAKGYLFIMIVSNTLTSSLSLRRLLKAADVKLKIYEDILSPLIICFGSGFLIKLIINFKFKDVLNLVFCVLLQSIIFIVLKRKSIRFLIKKC